MLLYDDRCSLRVDIGVAVVCRCCLLCVVCCVLFAVCRLMFPVVSCMSVCVLCVVWCCCLLCVVGACCCLSCVVICCWLQCVGCMVFVVRDVLFVVCRCLSLFAYRPLIAVVCCLCVDSCLMFGVVGCWFCV